MNFTSEPVRWKPFDHGIGIEECSIDSFRRRAQHAMKTNGICGHDCSFQFGSCESHHRGLPFFRAATFASLWVSRTQPSRIDTSAKKSESEFDYLLRAQCCPSVSKENGQQIL